MDVELNLISLCRGWTKTGWVSCHELAQAGEISSEDLLAKVAAREGLSQDDIIVALNALRNAQTPPENKRPKGKGKGMR